MELRHRQLRIDERAAQAVGASEDRSVELVFTTGAGVRRFDWWTGETYIEELSMDPAHVRMERLTHGAPLLAVHNQFTLDAVIGVTERAEISGNQGTAKVRFAKSDEGDKALALVRDGILRNVSVGYAVYRYEKIETPEANGLQTWRATDWEPVEISLVPVPADPGAQVRGLFIEATADQRLHTQKETAMPQRREPPLSAQRSEELQRDEAEIRRLGALTTGPERRAEILSRALSMGTEQRWAEALVGSDLPLESVIARMVDDHARRSAPAAPLNPTRSDTQPPQMQMRTLMAEMLVARMGGPAPSEPAHQYRHHRIVDMARELLEVTGVRTFGMSRMEMIGRAMTTSDLPYVLENVSNKMMLRGYADYPGGIKRICRRVLAADFKPLSRLQLAAGSDLEKVLEHGEFKHGKLIEAKNTYQVETFGRIISVSRQALVNDDLSALNQTAPLLGRMAAEREHKSLATLLTSNPTMGDSVALFHASHANLGTGTGSALSETSLAAAKLAMRTQKSLDNSTPIDATPRWLVVPATLEVTAQKLLTTITPAESDKVNVIPDWQLGLVVDPRLDSSSTTAWYLAADSAILGTIEYANLEDAPGPVIESRFGWEVDGLELKVRLDFGCGVTEWRGLYKANGA